MQTHAYIHFFFLKLKVPCSAVSILQGSLLSLFLQSSMSSQYLWPLVRFPFFQTPYFFRVKFQFHRDSYLQPQANEEPRVMSSSSRPRLVEWQPSWATWTAGFHSRPAYRPWPSCLAFPKERCVPYTDLWFHSPAVNFCDGDILKINVCLTPRIRKHPSRWKKKMKPWLLV